MHPLPPIKNSVESSQSRLSNWVGFKVKKNVEKNSSGGSWDKCGLFPNTFSDLKKNRIKAMWHGWTRSFLLFSLVNTDTYVFKCTYVRELNLRLVIKYQHRLQYSLEIIFITCKNIVHIFRHWYSFLQIGNPLKWSKLGASYSRNNMFRNLKYIFHMFTCRAVIKKFM